MIEKMVSNPSQPTVNLMDSKVLSIKISPEGEIEDYSSVWEDEELVLNVDDLEGIIQQLEAIHLGYAEMYSYFEIAEYEGWCVDDYL